MSTAAYGIEAIWEGQQWLLEGFDKLSMVIGRTVSGTISTAKGEDPFGRQISHPLGQASTVVGSGS